jgi:hypothetical protein
MAKEVWIQVFRAGKQTDSSGKSKEWSQKELQDIAEKYNNQPKENFNTAPLRPGDHEPVLDDNGNKLIKPALGFVKKLKEEGGNLFAQILPTPTLVKNIRDNYYKFVSIGLKQGLLDHIAILGGVKPAVKGLEPLAFSECFSEPNIDEISAYEFSVEDLDELEQFKEKFDSRIAPEGQDHNTPINQGGDHSAPGGSRNTTPAPDALNEEAAKENKPEENNTIINQYKESEMDIKQFGTAFLDAVKKDTSDDIAAKVGKIWASMSSQLSLGKPEESKAPSFSEDPEWKAMVERSRKLEAENREMKFNEKIGKYSLTPGIKPLAKSALEIAYRAENPSEFTEEYSYSEGDKKLTPTEVMEKLFSAYPDVTSELKGEFTAGKVAGSDADDEAKAIYEAVKYYQEAN